MARKIRTINKEKVETQKIFEEKLAELERLEKEAQDEEKNIVETAAKNIENVCTLNNLFCGVILTHEDLITVLQMALKSGEQVKIPFRLYFNE